MNSEKRKKIQRSMRKIISDFVIEKLPDEDNIFWIINISDILLSSDGSYLDVHVSCFIQQEMLTKTLAKHAYMIQRIMGKELHMRMNPKVRFRYDDSWKIWDEITKTINTLKIEL